MTTRKPYDEVLAALAKTPDDVALLSKLADLQAREGDQDAAAWTYLRIAECHQGHGFQLKAVANAKQALKLRPQHTAARELVAVNLVALGLMSEATPHLQLLLKHYTALGRRDDVVRILGLLSGTGPAAPGEVA